VNLYLVDGIAIDGVSWQAALFARSLLAEVDKLLLGHFPPDQLP
jgi:hypothetical protein